jgi:hypothetical protein
MTALTSNHTPANAILALDPEIVIPAHLPLDKTVPQPYAGTLRYGKNAQRSSRPSTYDSKGTNTANVKGGTCLQADHRPPLHRGQGQ